MLVFINLVERALATDIACSVAMSEYSVFLAPTFPFAWFRKDSAPVSIFILSTCSAPVLASPGRPGRGKMLVLLLLAGRFNAVSPLIRLVIEERPFW